MGILWDIMGCYGMLWEFYGMLWDVMGYYGMLWDFMGILWDVMGFYHDIPSGNVNITIENGHGNSDCSHST